MTKAQAIKKLKSLLILPTFALHQVGVGSQGFRKVYFATQRPYRPSEDDAKRIYYKVYVVIEGEMTDITQLVAKAAGVAFDHAHGIWEAVSTGGTATILRSTVHKDIAMWVL